MQLQSARRFVNRTAELAFVDDQLFQIKDGSPGQYCLINYHGVPGMGKTALLAELCAKYAEDDKIVMIALTMIDLPSTISLPNAKMYLLQSFAEYIARVSSQDTDGLLQQINNLSDEPATETLDAMLVSITALFEALPRPLFLIIDSWEHTPDALITWVERLLLLPLVRKNKIIGAFGSQVSLRWRQFEVRRRVKAHALGTLGPVFTEEQLDDTMLGKAVFEMTFGHPFANEVVFKMVRPYEAPVEWLEQHRTLVAQQIVTDLQDRVLADVTGELKQIFSIITLFREFDVNTLRVVLPQFYEEFRNRSQSALLISIKQLLETRLVSWSDEKRAYQLDATVRRIFARAIELSDLDRYTAIRTAAIEYYDRLIRDIPGSRNGYLVEYFYHDLYKAEPQMYNEANIHTTFEQFFKYYVSPDGRFLDQPAIASLRQLLLTDQELQEGLSRHNLPPLILAEILDVFCERTKAPKRMFG